MRWTQEKDRIISTLVSCTRLLGITTRPSRVTGGSTWGHAESQKRPDKVKTGDNTIHIFPMAQCQCTLRVQQLDSYSRTHGSCIQQNSRHITSAMPPQTSPRQHNIHSQHHSLLANAAYPNIQENSRTWNWHTLSSVTQSHISRTETTVDPIISQHHGH